MFETFTERARKVMSLSRQEALRLGSEFIDTHHLLLGLLEGRDCVACTVLKNLNLDARLIRQEIERRISPSESSAITMGQLPFSPRCKRVIELASDAARQLGDNIVGTEHVLAGLFDEGEGIAAQVLASLGLRRQELYDMIVEVLAVDRGVQPERPSSLSLDEWDLRRWALGYRPLTDRPSVQEPLVNLLQQGRSIALIGPKRVGKTALVLAMSRAKAGNLTYWSVDYRMFDEFHARELTSIRRRNAVCFISQAELLTSSRSVNANLLEDRMKDGERLLLEFREGGLEAFAARYPVLAKDLITVDVKAPDPAECRQLLEAARSRLKESAQLDIADDVLQEADRLARDRWRLVVPPWPTIIALWTAESIHRETSARGDLEQLERDIESPGRSAEEIELLKRHLEGLRSIAATGLTVESVRRAIGELSGQGSIPG